MTVNLFVSNNSLILYREHYNLTNSSHMPKMMILCVKKITFNSNKKLQLTVKNV